MKQDGLQSDVEHTFQWQGKKYFSFFENRTAIFRPVASKYTDEAI
jgi:hypothetical protein